MTVYEIETKDGKVYEVEVPDGTSQEDALKFLRSQLGGQVESQKARSFAQGLSFGFADEIEAGIRSAFGEEEYADVRDKIRKQLADYSRQNGTEALAMEIAGASIPTLVSQFIPVLGQSATAANVSRLATMADRMKRASKIGAVEGAVAGAGYSESEDLGGVVGDVATGAGLGATVAPVAGMALGKAVGKFSDVIGEATRSMGKKGADAVEREVRKIAKETGFSPDELIEQAMQGRAISDNRTLAATVRALASKSGSAKTVLRESYDTRSKEKLGQFYDEMDSSLQGFTGSPNIKALQDLSDEQNLVNDLYKQARDNQPEFASPEVVSAINDVTSFYPQATKRIPKIKDTVQGTAANPLMGIKATPTKKVERLNPTIQNAESVRKSVADVIKRAYAQQVDPLKEYGRSIDELKAIEQNLRTAIDGSSDAMRAARQKARERFTLKDSYEAGLKMATAGKDKQAEIMRELLMSLGRNDLTPDQLQKLREGIAFKLREPRGKNTQMSVPRSIVNPDSPQSNLLDMVGAGSDEMARKAKLAEDTFVMKNLASPDGQSITQFAQESAKSLGVDISPAELMQIMNGDPVSMLTAGTKIVKGLFKGGLSDQQMADIAKVLVSEDPQLLRRVLLGQESAEQVTQQVINKALQYGIVTEDIARRALTQQMAQE